MVSEIDGVKRVLVDTVVLPIDTMPGARTEGAPDLPHPIPVRTLGAMKGTLRAIRAIPILHGLDTRCAWAADG